MKILILLLAVFGYCFALEEKCPKTDISPCTCKTYFDGACIIACSGIGKRTNKTLAALADIPNLCDGHIRFGLLSSTVSGIPAKLWKVLLSSKTVDITLRHSDLEGLTPPGENIPEVSTPGSAIIKIEHSTVSGWDWTQLRKFYSEEELTLVIEDTPLTELSPDFSNIAEGQVHKITIDSAGLATIPDKIFANFDDLNSLSLQNNKLTTISRSIMPKPANKLQFLHLNGNLLTTLPEDLFSDMPSLEIAYLRDNRLTSLPEKLFQSISSNKFQRIDFVRNPWKCDCKLMWILASTKKRTNMGKCDSPDSLAGKKIRDLPSLLDC